MWHTKPLNQLYKEFETDPDKGLTFAEGEKRLAKYGENRLPEGKKLSILSLFLSQFQNVMIIILLIAVVIAFILGETVDAVAIVAIVILNASIGLIQELSAIHTLDALKQKDVIYTLVLRDSTVEKIPVTEVVPGDILVLEEGTKIPSDARIIEAVSLRIDESILTGESMPGGKRNTVLKNPKLPLADRDNMVYKDTKVIAGRGKALVVATGKDTEIGTIATYLGSRKSDHKTPLTIELEQVGKFLSIVIIIIAVLIFILATVQETPLITALLVSISLAVAAIPEGLPAIVTVVLSLGMERLADKKSIVKKLPAVETLGAIRIIATDKTGTLTENKINAVRVILPNFHSFTIEGEGYQTSGVYFDEHKKIVNPERFRSLKELLTSGILANNATLKQEDSETEVIGDTTEGALLVAGIRAQMNPQEIIENYPRVYEIPFSSERKMMSVIVKTDDTKDHILFMKGAPEVILEHCILSESDRTKLMQMTKNMAHSGLRNLAFARKILTVAQVKKAMEQEILSEDRMEFLGLVGMQDPLREEVPETIAKAKEAGIQTVMITGDHKETAIAIALVAGITDQSEQVLTETEIQSMSEQQIQEAYKAGTHVFARISPMGKLKIVQALKKIPNTQIAVTGDGVNDAPAIKAADIGIAMGKTGTDLTREVADIVITDDNYVTIIDAVREGRVIFANLVKFIRYLISCNLSEVLVVTLGMLFSTPIPLASTQLLWVNFITDGMPALALGMDPAEQDVMQRPPRDIRKGIIYRKRWIYMAIEGTIMGVLVFGLYIISLTIYSFETARTMAFAALALVQIVHSFNNRSTHLSLFEIGVFSNPYLIGAAVISTLLQIAVIETAIGNHVFKTTPLLWEQWGLVAATGLLTFLIVEIKKRLRLKILP